MVIYSGKTPISSGSTVTKLSELMNDVGYVTNVVDNLINYYKKTDVYNKEELNTLLGDLDKINLEVVNQLPSTDISTSTIYLIKVSDGIYEQHLWVEKDNQFVSLGTTQVNLEGYAKSDDVPTNTELLNKFSTDENGKLLFNGSPIEGTTGDFTYASNDDIDALFD